MPAHIVNGEFQSDKYPTCPPGKVPLSVKDRSAQDLLWEYARRRRQIDEEFSEDLETALKAAGYKVRTSGFASHTILRDVAAYLIDRADQYETSSPCWIALSDAALNLLNGDVEQRMSEGEFDGELYARVDAMRGPTKPVEPSLGVGGE